MKKEDLKDGMEITWDRATGHTITQIVTYLGTEGYLAHQFKDGKFIYETYTHYFDLRDWSIVQPKPKWPGEVYFQTINMLFDYIDEENKIVSGEEEILIKAVQYLLKQNKERWEKENDK